MLHDDGLRKGVTRVFHSPNITRLTFSEILRWEVWGINKPTGLTNNFPLVHSLYALPSRGA